MAVLTWQTAAVVLLVALVALVIKYPNRAIGSSPNESGMPGEEEGWPLLGAIRMLFDKDFNSHQLHYNLNRYKAEGEKRLWPKTVTLPIFGRLVFINHPVYLEYVQKTNFSNYPKGDFFRKQFVDLLGHAGIFVSDGDLWSVQRKLASRIFSVGNFKNHVQTTLHKELDVLEELLGWVAKGGEALDLQHVFFRFTLQNFGIIGFNKSFGALPRHPSELHDKIQFAEAFDYCQLVLDDRWRDPIWELKEPWSAKGRRMRESVKVIHDYAYSVIDERLAQRAQLSVEEKKSLAESERAKDLLDLYMDNGGMGRDALMEVVLNMIIAGRDTTAQALSWMFWELCARPEVMRRVKGEVDEYMKRKRTEGATERWMTYEDMNQFPYLHACWNETLRLHPSVPKNGKEAAADDWLPARPEDGVPPIKIHKGDFVAWSDWGMARLPELWGPDCEQFKPERFLGDDGRVLKFSPYKQHYFNAGPRACLGETLATYEGMAITAAILGRYDVSLVEGYEKEPHYAASVTHPLATPYLVRIANR